MENYPKLMLAKEIATTVFTWLDGKKTYIFGAISLTVAYLGLQGTIDQNTQSFIQALIVLFAGSAEYGTVRLGARR